MKTLTWKCTVCEGLPCTLLMAVLDDDDVDIPRCPYSNKPDWQPAYQATTDNQGVPVAESDAHAREPECGMRPVSVWHGKTCQRQEHTKGGYGHDFDDDSPYDVDGVSYCGRCHHCLDESERVDIVGPEQQADIIASQRERAEEDAQNRHRSPL